MYAIKATFSHGASGPHYTVSWGAHRARVSYDHSWGDGANAGRQAILTALGSRAFRGRLSDAFLADARLVCATMARPDGGDSDVTVGVVTFGGSDTDSLPLVDRP